MAINKWECEFCKKTFNTKEEAIEHENICSFNVKNKKCDTCEFYKETGYHISGSDIRCIYEKSELYNQNIEYFLEDNEDKENIYFPCKCWVKERISF